MKAFVTAALVALFTSFSNGLAFAQTPQVTKIQNNYSYILPGMPTYGIAQGSIFDVFGVGLATVTSTLQNVPLPKSLSGTSVSVTVSGATMQAILYFVSPGQIAAILPSATPAGTGQLTVTLNGRASEPAAITVVQSAFGMMSLNGVGNGPAAAFDVNSSFLGLTNAANPGDFITLWGSGLGPVTGDETVSQTPVNLTPNIPIEVDIGGKISSVLYAGRSVYPGLDQINVQVPAGVSGCHTSVVVRTGDIVSNFGTIPVASGGRVCAEPVAGLTASQIQTLMSQATIVKGAIEVDAGVAVVGSAMDAYFARFTNTQFALKQPFATASFNDCVAINYRNTSFGIGNPIQPVFLDAGATIMYTTPSSSGIGNGSIPNQAGDYNAPNLMPNGSFKGTYTFTGSGGADIGAFSAQVDWPGGGGGFSYLPSSGSSVTRSSGLTVTWTSLGSSDPGEFIQISGYSFAPNNPFGAEFVCDVPLAAGRFTIPAAVLLALPVQPTGSMQSLLELDVIVSKGFSAPGMDFGNIDFVFGNPEPFFYQ